jgi:hypothetical protein
MMFGIHDPSWPFGPDPGEVLSGARCRPGIAASVPADKGEPAGLLPFNSSGPRYLKGPRLERV